MGSMQRNKDPNQLPYCYPDIVLVSLAMMQDALWSHAGLYAGGQIQGFQCHNREKKKLKEY